MAFFRIDVVFSTISISSAILSCFAWENESTCPRIQSFSLTAGYFILKKIAPSDTALPLWIRYHISGYDILHLRLRYCISGYDILHLRLQYCISGYDILHLRLRYCIFGYDILHLRLRYCISGYDILHLRTVA
jgi:hypothetical protein